MTSLHTAYPQVYLNRLNARRLIRDRDVNAVEVELTTIPVTRESGRRQAQ